MLKVFAVYDEKAESYGSLMCLPTRGLALRAFSDACADNRSPMAQSPSDFKMYELGEYDPNSGLIKGHSVPSFVCSATQMVNQLALARTAPVEVPA